MLQDGTTKDSQKEANYWHQDGEFWGTNLNHIYNILHTRVIPEEGGETWVMDAVAGAQFLKEKHPKLYNRLKELIGVVNIE